MLITNGLGSNEQPVLNDKLSIDFLEKEVQNSGIGLPKGLKLKNEQLHKRNACKYIGVYLDKHLVFYDHIEDTVKKLNQLIGMIKKFREIYHIKCYLKLKNFVAKSKSSHGSLTYGSAAKKIPIKFRMLNNKYTNTAGIICQE